MGLSIQLRLFLLYTLLLSEAGCISDIQKDEHTVIAPKTSKQLISHGNQTKQIPVLCYHALRNVKKNDTPNQKAYSVSPANFASQVKLLAANGYVTISPDQLKEHFTKGTPLPKKPIIITFDDGRKEHYSIGAKILDRYHFKGVFFIMTVTIGKRQYLNREEIKALSDEGHVIGCHSWDHHKVTDFKKGDWKRQLLNSRITLQNITGRTVTSFAYPYGVWTPATADSLQSSGYTTAFIVYGKQDPGHPLYTIQRTIVPNTQVRSDFINILATY